MILQFIASAERGVAPVGFTFIDLISAVLIGAGVVFFFGASVGIVRFPDFYTRMHAAGKGDTLSTLLITTGMAVQVMGQFDLHHWTVVLVALKILAIGLFIMLTSPTSTHALMKAGFDDGIEPVTNSDRMLMRNLGGPFLKGAQQQPVAGKSGDPEASGKSKPAAKKQATGKKRAAKKVAKKAVKKTAKKVAKKAAKKVTKKAAKKVAPKKKTSTKKAPRRKKD